MPIKYHLFTEADEKRKKKKWAKCSCGKHYRKKRNFDGFCPSCWLKKRKNLIKSPEPKSKS